MPTALTENILSGGSFENFVWVCAKRFAPFIGFRDSPANDLSQIIPEIKPDPQYQASVARAHQKLNDLSALSEEEWQMHLKEKYDMVLATWQSEEEARILQRSHADKVRSQVLDWEPPTEEHEGLKQFMLNQLELLYSWDLEETKPPLWEDFVRPLSEAVQEAREELEWAKVRARNAEEEAFKNTAWIQQLWFSVRPSPV